MRNRSIPVWRWFHRTIPGDLLDIAPQLMRAGNVRARARRQPLAGVAYMMRHSLASKSADS